MVQLNTREQQKPRRIPAWLRWGAVAVLLISAIVIAVLYWNPAGQSDETTPGTAEELADSTSENDADASAENEAGTETNNKADSGANSDTSDSSDAGSDEATGDDAADSDATNPETQPSFDLTQHSIDDPNSIWLVTNKHRPINPRDFEPSDLVYPTEIENEFAQPLRAPAATAVDEMYLAAQNDGVWFRIISAYRPYSVQENLYASYGARDGFELADTYSARPGHSEHQTGLAVDFDDGGDCYLMECFADTQAGTWLADNAANFGFIVRYQPGQEGTTGFMPEPWHLRYVGIELAQHMQDVGAATLEEVFNIDPAPDYLD